MKKGKTVGEILKEEGVIKETPRKEEVKEEKLGFLDELSLKKTIMEIEKLRAEVDGLKEVKFHSDERIKELAESIGELRALIFQRDSLIKETESKLKVLEDAVSDIRPEKIIKEMKMKEEEIERSEAEVEKVKTMEKDVVKDVREIQNIVKNIKSVDNLRETVKNMEDLVLKANETKADIDRLASKSERFYTEMEGRIKEFPEFKTKLEKIDEFTKEITKSMDEINIKLASFTPKEELEGFKKTIDSLIASNKENLEVRIKEVENALNVPSDEMSSKMEELEKRRKSILNLLSNLEEQYRKAAIKQETYNEVKGKNDMLLNQIVNEMNKLESEKGVTVKSLPSIINEVEKSIKTVEEKTDTLESSINDIKSLNQSLNLEGKIALIEEKNRDINPEKIDKTYKAIKIQTEIIENMLTDLRDTKNKITEISKDVVIWKHETRFYEILDIICRQNTAEGISNYLDELENLILKMKEDDIWGMEKLDLIKSLFSELSKEWRNSGNSNMSDMFDNFLEKIQTSSNFMSSY
jgi:DNA repair exonuclease SbcCD ATPase subunit